MTQPTVDRNGIVYFTSSYPMEGTDMYVFTITNNQPANLLNTYTKYYKNSASYDTGVSVYPDVSFYISVTPYQDGVPRTQYTIPFTTLLPSEPLLLTVTQTGPSSAFLQWLVPETDQYVSTITSYTVRYNTTTITVPSNSASISGLSGTLFFQVCATNMAGTGPYSVGVIVAIH